MDNPRELALHSLIKWETQGAFSNLEINTAITRSQLSKKDISLYTLLYMGVVEKKLFLDNVIAQYSTTPLDKIDITALNILRLGIYQLVFTDRIPDHSAVDECVKLSPKKSKGFVNAVLRSFLRNGKKINYPENKWQRLSIEKSVPMELTELFIKSYGEKTAESLLTYEETEHLTSLRVNTLKASEGEIENKITALGYKAIKSEIAPDIIKTDAPVSEIKDILDTGCAFVQDEASRLCALTVGALPGERIADTCACPGGKSFSLAIDMKNEGYIYSSDLHKSKLSLVTRGAKNLGINIIEAGVQNAKERVASYENEFDRVLCDVPCSGLGVIYKKPEIKYKSIESIDALPSIQYEILTNVSAYVKVGGYLIYSTCTVNKAENEDNIDKFLRENGKFEPVDFFIGKMSSCGGKFTFFPHECGTDGFFVAKMKRIK